MGKLRWPYHEVDKKIQREKRRKEIEKEVREIERSFDLEFRKGLIQNLKEEGFDTTNVKPYSDYLWSEEEIKEIEERLKKEEQE